MVLFTDTVTVVQHVHRPSASLVLLSLQYDYHNDQDVHMHYLNVLLAHQF